MSSKLPPASPSPGRTDNAIGAVEDTERRIYGVEFHPEVNHTDRGTEILQNFIFAICGAKQNWNRAGFIAEPASKPSANKPKARAQSVRLAEEWIPRWRPRWCIARSATA
jgi:GMP synthase (glutamine-hydrolysing)